MHTPAPVGPPACPLDLVQITQSAPTVTGLYGQFWQAGSVPATPIIDSHFANVNSISGPTSISSLPTHNLGPAASICNGVYQSATFGENGNNGCFIYSSSSSVPEALQVDGWLLVPSCVGNVLQLGFQPAGFVQGATFFIGSNCSNMTRLSLIHI